jgi:hypothetical protein
MRDESKKTWLLYGANGYTGELIADEAKRRGMRPILSERLGFEWRVFPLDNRLHALRRLDGMILQVAGPSGERRSVSLPSFDPKPSARWAVEVLAEVGMPYALIGKVAMWALLPVEAQEFTKEVDFAVPRRAAEPLRAAIANRGFAARDLPIGGLAVRSEDLRVDFIDRREGGFDSLYEEAIAEAERSGPRADVGGASVPVVTAEHLLAMKVVAAEDRDQADAVRLLKALPGLDLGRARAIVLRHGGPVGANLLDALGRRAGRPDARPECRNGG